LALLRATGFSQRQLSRLVLFEHLTLLLGGLGIGVVAALVAVVPHAWTTQIRPPWETLLGVLGIVLLVGLLSGYLALRPIARAPIVEALQSN
jgi:ABC-type antimicrobial peptide transport system permease subunit